MALAISKLPPFVLADGKYTLAQRVGAGVYKGGLFSACGFAGSLGGTTLAYMLFQVMGNLTHALAKHILQTPLSRGLSANVLFCKMCKSLWYKTPLS